MDNITHTLAGLAIAEVAAPAGVSGGRRRVWVATGIAAANLPDLDLAWTWLAPPPLGYLLHHRGHSHTLAGLVVLGACLAAALRLWPAVRAVPAEWRGRLAVVAAINLIGHLSLDALNSYGIHPWYPFSPRWHFGDAVFIFEPWIWLVLGLCAAWNARSTATRIVAGVVPAGLLTAVMAAGLVPPAAIGLLTAAALGTFSLIRRRQPAARAGVALALTAAFAAGMAGVSRAVRLRAADAAGIAPASVVDVVRSPDPGVPLCWAVAVLSRDAARDELRTIRGTLSLAPGWYPAGTCASARLTGPAASSGESARFALRDEDRLPLARLRTLARDDCRARAWLQFGRAPAVRDEVLLDLRFETPVRRNFTAMPLAAGGGCPPALTAWRPPRVDLLAGP